MAIEFDNFDSLVKGSGYQNVSAPATDVDPNTFPSVKVLDSHNDQGTFDRISIATTAQDGPENPAPYWNSGEKETQGILE